MVSLSAEAQEQFIGCPVATLDTAVTTDLPTGWWATPQVGGPLVGTEIMEVAGRQTLVCRYRGYNTAIPVMREIPAGFAACSPVNNGFRCSTATGRAAQREPTPVTQARSTAQIPVASSNDVKLGVDQPQPNAPASKPAQASRVTQPRVEAPQAQRSPNEIPRPTTQAQGKTQVPTNPQPSQQGRVVLQPPITVEQRTRAPSTNSKQPEPATPVTQARVEVPRGTSSVPTAIMERSFAAGTRLAVFWRCEGNTCTRIPLDHDEVSECRALAQAAGRVVWFSTPNTFLNAAQLEDCNSPMVQRFEVTACSGADDLRQNSTFHITWIVARRNVDTTRGYPII
jgi:hypothetical protein